VYVGDGCYLGDDLFQRWASCRIHVQHGGHGNLTCVVWWLRGEHAAEFCRLRARSRDGRRGVQRAYASDGRQADDRL
jgi:hypothetical protein